MKENIAALIFNWITDFLLVGFSLTSLWGRVPDGARGGGVHPVQDRADLHPLHGIQAHSVPDPGGWTENGKSVQKAYSQSQGLKDTVCIYAETMQKLVLISMTIIYANLGEEATPSPDCCGAGWGEPKIQDRGRGGGGSARIILKVEIVKLRSRSRSGEGQVRVRKVRVRSESCKDLNINLKTWYSQKRSGLQGGHQLDV